MPEPFVPRLIDDSGGARPVYRFPESVAQEPWVVFRVAQSAIGHDTQPDVAAIALRLPPSALKVHYGVNYKDAELGSTLGRIAHAIPGIQNRIKQIVTEASTKENIFDQVKSFVTDSWKSVQANGSDALATGLGLGSIELQQGLQAIGDALGFGVTDVVSAVTRQRINNRLEVLFESVSLREFNFSWVLAPSSERESKVIEDILSIFKVAMLPDYQSSIVGTVNDAYFGYPYEFEIELFDSDYMINPQRCVLTSMDIDYAQAGVSSFFKTGADIPGDPGNRLRTTVGRPTQIALSCNFKELKLINRSHFTNEISSGRLQVLYENGAEGNGVRRYKF